MPERRNFLILLLLPCLPLAPAGAEKELPSHVGKDLPDYVTGDECLFCHRSTGSAWQRNPHQATLRPMQADPGLAEKIRSHPRLADLAGEAEYLLGGSRAVRLLRKSERYGQLEMLSAFLRPEGGRLKALGPPPWKWDAQVFADRCSGCHATATDSRTRSFAAVGIDCYACHGAVDLAHANDRSKVLFSSGRPATPQLVASTCGQCHIRSGRSRASGLPYANNHVAGDDLFADFEVDLSPEALERLPPRERHVLASIREMRAGRTAHSCLACHRVHGEDGLRHRRVAHGAVCDACHGPEELKYDPDAPRSHPLCQY